MLSIAWNARSCVPSLRAGRICLAALFAIQCAPAVQAGDGSITETIVWAQSGEGRDIAVSYSRDRDGMGKLQFRELQRRGSLPIAWLVESNRDIVRNLAVTAMQPFGDLFVVTLKTDSAGYIVQVFTFDDRLDVINEVVNTNGQWMPELIYFGDQADPAIAILKQQAGVRAPSAAAICGEKIYVLNQRTRRIEEMMGRWANRGRGEVSMKPDSQCTE
jgi:hypothetical protein